MSSVAESLPSAEAHEEQHDVGPIRKTARWVFLGSECVFFGSMISTFLLYRNTTNGGPGAEIFDIPFTSASSFVLLMSSLTMVLAHNAFERKDFHGAHVAVGVLMLGAMFLLSLSGRLYEDRGMNIELVGLYWHFVDIVWIVIFTVVYLMQIQ